MAQVRRTKEGIKISVVWLLRGLVSLLCIAYAFLVAPIIRSGSSTSEDTSVRQGNLHLASKQRMLENAWKQLSPTINVTSFHGKTFENFLPRTQGREGHVVLTTHLSANEKLDRLLIQLRWWRGPASVAVYMRSLSSIGEFFEFYRKNLALFGQVSFHFMLEETNLEYPHNRLRNLALRVEEQSDLFVFLVDVDFIPSWNCHQTLQSLASKISRTTKTAWVVPAFASSMPDSRLPKSRAELLSAWASGRIVGFDQRPHYPPGHRATNYSHWKALDEANEKHFSYPIPFEDRFEPYAVVEKAHDLPEFWNGFRGFGYNKMSWFIELDRIGYSFEILRDAWVIHLEHAVLRKSKRQGLKNNKVEWESFQAYLEATYGSRVSP